MKDLKYKEDSLKLNLQFFAEEGEGVDTSTTENKEGQINNNSDNIEKLFSQAEVDEMMKGFLSQEQVDEIVEKRLLKERIKIAEEKADSKRLSGLSAEDRAKEEAKGKDNEIAELKEQLRLKELDTDTTNLLHEKGIDISFKDFLMRNDSESTLEAVKVFKRVYDEAVEKEVEKRYLVGETPSISNVSGGSAKINIGEYAAESRLIK